VALSFHNANTNNRIVFNQKIQHGPIVFDKGLHLALALITAESDDPNFKATAHTIWDLDRNIITEIKIPTLDVSSAPLHFVLQNLNMQMNYHSVREMLKAKIDIEKMELQFSTASPFTVILNNIKTTQDLNKENNIWYGSRSGNIAEIDVSGPQGSIAQIHDFSGKGSITAEEDKTNIQVNYQAKNASIYNNPLDAVDFAFSIKNIDTKALSNVLEKLQAKKDQPSQINFNALSESAFDLIKKGVSIQLDHLSLMTKQGEAKADGQVTLPPLSAGNIFQVLAALKVDFNVQVPKDWLIMMLDAQNKNENAQQQVDQWIQEKVLIPAPNNMLTMKIQFENSKLLVNGLAQQPAASAPAAVAAPAPASVTAPAPTQ
jgi:uncharacterized protein YdgA (DUF945 family)